jgi:tRNA threonylcarbamoyladenosine biosynthesis protein TsaE
MERHLRSVSEAETRLIGERIGKCLTAGDILALVGRLGAGKTCLTQGIARGLGLREQEIVSPTYRLIHEVNGPVRLFHVDLYRISDADDLENAGFYDAFDDDAVTIIEWADRIPSAIPDPHLEVRLQRVNDNERDITFVPHEGRYRNLVERLLKNLPEE